MDGFDDLLAPSRRALEQNPFEDPFAKPRSSSPDPWSSFHPTQEHEDQSAFPPEGTADPLDSAALQHDEPLSPPATDTSALASPPTSPGFRESVSTHIDHVLEPPPSDSDHPQPTHAQRPSVSSSLHPAPKTLSEPAVVSPLDPPAPPAIDRPFAGLALGGESVGGWQSAPNAFAPSPSAPPTGVGLGFAPRRSVDGHDEDDEDDDDDKPILQSARTSLGERVQAPVQQRAENENGIQPVFTITVDDPQKVGDPIRPYTMYTVHTQTTSPLFSKSRFSVLRRYSDFLWLYETLSLNNPGVVVPPVPEKSGPFGTFGRFDRDFVQQRRAALEKCVRKMVAHPVLVRDPDLKCFLESDSFALDIKHRKAEIAHEKGGLMATIGQTIAGPRFYETDEWFDKQKAYLDSLELQLKGLVKAIDTVAKHRAELASAISEFAQTIEELGASELGPRLQSALAGLAEVERKAMEVQGCQGREDMGGLGSVADEYSRLINSVRLAFNSRVRTYHAWQNADATVRRVKQSYEASRSSSSSSTHPHTTGSTSTSTSTSTPTSSLAFVAEAERRALEAKREFEQVSRLVKAEVARFEEERVEDFKESLERFLEGMVGRQRELIAAWEGYQGRLLGRGAGGAGAGVGAGGVGAGTGGGEKGVEEGVGEGVGA